MQEPIAWAPALAGFVIGVVAGFAARYARLCTFSAIEDALVGGDSRRLRVFGLALGIAILGTQGLILAKLLDPKLTTYVPSAIPALAIIIGSTIFGIGMALVGTCGFGSLVRLGTGDMRALVAVIVLGACAYATLRGIFSSFRIEVLERISLPMRDQSPSDFVSLIGANTGSVIHVALALAAGMLLCWFAFGDRRLRRTPRLVGAGAILGLMIVSGWIATIWLQDEFSTPRPQSLTFVSTIGRALYAGLLNVAAFGDFGVASVFGVMLGAGLAAWIADEWRWEAFDDDREMRRHLLGAALMGCGGILAGGCTIGQGLTAGSLMALSWPIAVIGMIAGARLGIALLMDDSPKEIFARGWSLFRQTIHPRKR